MNMMNRTNTWKLHNVLFLIILFFVFCNFDIIFAKDENKTEKITKSISTEGFMKVDPDFDDEEMVPFNNTDLIEEMKKPKRIDTELLEEGIRNKQTAPFEDLAHSVSSKSQMSPFSPDFIFFNSDAIIKSLGKKKLTKINARTGKPYGVVALVCLRCHTDLHVAHPLEVSSPKIQLPIEANFPLGSQGTGLTCRSCHLKMNNNYKFLRWPTDGGKHKERFCVHCHATQGKSERRKAKGDLRSIKRVRKD